MTTQPPRQLGRRPPPSENGYALIPLAEQRSTALVSSSETLEVSTTDSSPVVYGQGGRGQLRVPISSRDREWARRFAQPSVQEVPRPVRRPQLFLNIAFEWSFSGEHPDTKVFFASLRHDSRRDTIRSTTSVRECVDLPCGSLTCDELQNLLLHTDWGVQLLKRAIINNSRSLSAHRASDVRVNWSEMQFYAGKSTSFPHAYLEFEGKIVSEGEMRYVHLSAGTTTADPTDSYHTSFPEPGTIRGSLSVQIEESYSTCLSTAHLRSPSAAKPPPS